MKAIKLISMLAIAMICFTTTSCKDDDEVGAEEIIKDIEQGKVGCEWSIKKSGTQTKAVVTAIDVAEVTIVAEFDAQNNCKKFYQVEKYLNDKLADKAWQISQTQNEAGMIQTRDGNSITCDFTQKFYNNPRAYIDALIDQDINDLVKGFEGDAPLSITQ